MELFACELKKLFKRRGILLTALFLLLRVVFLLLLDTPFQEELELYRQDYDYYLSQAGGPVTEDSAAFLDGVSQRLSEAAVNLPKLYDSFYDQTITREELTAQAAPYEEALSRRNGFQLLYQQFIYARENPENRYLLYDNGWNALLANGTLDVMLVGLLLLLVTPIFCHEYHSGMDVLNLTAPRGAGRLTLAKLLLAAAVVTCLCLLNSALEYGFYELRYGLPHGDYPLQSLRCFGSSAKGLTLSQAFILVALSRWFGSLFFAVLTMFLSVLTQKYALTLASSTAMLLIPCYAVQSEAIRYALPGPLAFLLGTGFLRGTETAAGPFSQPETVLFREITGGGLCLLIGEALLLLAAMLYWIFRKTSPARQRGGSGRRKRRAGAAALCLALLAGMTGMTGCAAEESAEYDVYNAAHRAQFENERYRIWFDWEEETLLCEDKKTGLRERLARDPLQLSSSIASCVYGNGRYVYYFRSDYNRAGRYPGLERISLIEVDTETFQERVVYEDARRPLEEVFFGSGINALFDGKTRQGARVFLEDVWAFFIKGDVLYLLREDVKTLDLRSGRMAAIDGPCPVKGSFAFDGRTLYYTTDRFEVEAYDTETGETRTIPGLITKFFFLTDTRFFYINRADGYRLYAMDIRNETTVRLTERPVLEFEVEEGTIRYTDRLDRKSYRMDEDGRHETPET